MWWVEADLPLLCRAGGGFIRTHPLSENVKAPRQSPLDPNGLQWPAGEHCSMTMCVRTHVCEWGGGEAGGRADRCRRPEVEHERFRQPCRCLAGPPSRRRDCHSAAPPSTFSRRFNSDGEGISAK